MSAAMWAHVPNTAGMYSVSRDGRVRSNRSGRLLAIGDTGDGYRKVMLPINGRRRAFRLHRLMLVSFVGPRPPGMQGCHGDGDRLNNRLSNLRYDTPANNNAEKSHHGTAHHHPRKLTPDDVTRIREQALFGAKRADQAKAFAVARNTICCAVNRVHWRNIASSSAPPSTDEIQATPAAHAPATTHGET